MATLNATPANFASVLASAAAGDTVLCADGTYNVGTVSKAAASEIAIQAENPLGAVFNGMTLSGSFLTFDGIEFTGNVAPDGKSFILRGADNCQFLRCRIGSANARSSNDILVKHCRFTNESGGSPNRLGLQLERGGSGNFNWVIEANLFRGDGSVPVNDYIQLQDSWSVVIRRNTFYDLGISYNSGTSGEYAHVDFIQVYHIDDQCDDIEISDNWFYDDYATRQNANGIWTIPINANATNLTITGNIIVTGSSNGLFVTGPNASTLIDGNLVLAWPDSLSNVSNNGGIIRLNGGGGATVTDNACISITNSGSTTPSGNITKSKAQLEADLDFTDAWASIGDYEPTVSDYDGQAWLTRLNGILDGSQDFYAPDGTLQTDGSPPPPSAPELPGTVTLSVTVS